MHHTSVHAQETRVWQVSGVARYEVDDECIFLVACLAAPHARADRIKTERCAFGCDALQFVAQQRRRPRAVLACIKRHRCGLQDHIGERHIKIARVADRNAVHAVGVDHQLDPADTAREVRQNLAIGFGWIVVLKRLPDGPARSRAANEGRRTRHAGLIARRRHVRLAIERLKRDAVARFALQARPGRAFQALFDKRAPRRFVGVFAQLEGRLSHFHSG